MKLRWGERVRKGQDARQCRQARDLRHRQRYHGTTVTRKGLRIARNRCLKSAGTGRCAPGTLHRQCRQVRLLGLTTPTTLRIRSPGTQRARDFHEGDSCIVGPNDPIEFRATRARPTGRSNWPSSSARGQVRRGRRGARLCGRLLRRERCFRAEFQAERGGQWVKGKAMTPSAPSAPTW